MEWPRGWYPLCPARDLRPGTVREVQAFARRLAVFRTAAGEPGVLDARCAHFGADLARGTVTAAGLRCPLHGRCFATSGACATATGGQPARDGQPAWVACEAFGLVFCHLGAEPGPLPGPDGGSGDRQTAPTSFAAELDLLHIGANAFDAAHLGPVHGRTLVDEPELVPLGPAGLRIAFAVRVAGSGWRDRLLRAVGLRELRIDTDCWGANLLFFHHRRVGAWTLHAAVPVDRRSVRVFSVSGIAGRGWRQRLRLWLHHRAVAGFIREDGRALAGITLGAERLDAQADRTLAAWLDYARALPRVSA